MADAPDPICDAYEQVEAQEAMAQERIRPTDFMPNDKVFTCAEVAALPDDGWVNGSVSAHALKIDIVAKKAGGNFWKATLGDAPGDYTNCVSLSLFMAPKFQQGDQIRLGGGGIKKSSYQGKPQISMGKSSTVEVIPGTQRIAAAIETSQQQRHANGAQQANEQLINGAQVGGAVKTVFEALKPTASDMANPLFWATLHEHASDYVRLCQLIEKGKLAAPIRERAGKPAGRPQHDPERELEAEDQPPF